MNPPASPVPPLQRQTPHHVVEYLAVGNPTLDVRRDGRTGLAEVPTTYTVGGTVVYAAVQADRLGLAATVAGRVAVADQPVVRSACGPGVTQWFQPAESTTVFDNSLGQPRVQQVRSWAGPVDLEDLPARCGILHVGPVAWEVDLTAARVVSADFVGITPQGMLRQWDATGQVSHLPLAFVAGPRADAAVLSVDELPFARPLVDDVVSRGGVVVVTKGADGCTVLTASDEVDYPAFTVTVADETGAGDVFAAAFFVEYARGAGVAPSVRFAAAAAALSIQAEGAAAVTGRDRIERFVAEHAVVSR